MQTFIEQKKEVQRRIDEIDRENASLYDRIDHNGKMLIELQKTLDKVGKEVSDETMPGMQKEADEGEQ